MKTRVKFPEYLGLTIDFTLPGKVEFTMIDYIQEMLGDLPEDKWVPQQEITCSK